MKMCFTSAEEAKEAIVLWIQIYKAMDTKQLRIEMGIESDVLLLLIAFEDKIQLNSFKSICMGIHRVSVNY